MKIITDNIRPPVPTRAYDWVAYFEGQEEGGPTGYGSTEDAAILELLEISNKGEEE